MGRKPTIEEIEEKLANAKKKYLRVYADEEGCISKYDLDFGYDREFYLIRVPLLANHILYYQRQLAEMNKERQLTLF